MRSWDSRNPRIFELVDPKRPCGLQDPRIPRSQRSLPFGRLRGSAGLLVREEIKKGISISCQLSVIISVMIEMEPVSLPRGRSRTPWS